MNQANHSHAVDDKGLVSVAEAARYLGLARSTLYGLMETGQLPYAKFGRARRIPHRAIVTLAESAMRGGWALPDPSGTNGNLSTSQA